MAHSHGPLGTAFARLKSTTRSPERVSMRVATTGAVYPDDGSHRDAGTSAGAAYASRCNRSTSWSGFCWSTFMLKCTLPVAPGCARVSLICSRISSVRHPDEFVKATLPV